MIKVGHFVMVSVCFVGFVLKVVTFVRTGMHQVVFVRFGFFTWLIRIVSIMFSSFFFFYNEETHCLYQYVANPYKHFVK